MSKKEDAVTRNVINVAYTILGLTALTPPIIGLIQDHLTELRRDTRASVWWPISLATVGLCTESL